MEFSTIESALAAIRRGEIVVVVDDQNREHEGDLIAAAEFATPISSTSGDTWKRLVCAPLDTTITNRLNLIPMTARNRIRWVLLLHFL